MKNSRNLRLGLIGLGRWGTNYAQTIWSVDGLELSAISTRGQRPAGYHDVPHTRDWRCLQELAELDGVIISSSPETHYEMASTFLAQGVPVILEKPACYLVEECEKLLELSLKHSAPCVVGYTHLYSSAYRGLRRRSHAANVPAKIRSRGVSDGPFRNDVDVLWDWGSHDVAMCLDYLKEYPADISVTLEECDPVTPNACIYSLDLHFPSGACSSSKFGNISHVKERTFWVCREKHELCYDGLGQVVSEINGSVERHVDYSQGPRPLTNLVNEFAKCIRNGVQYHWSIGLAIEVTKIISIAEEKLNHRKRTS